MKYLEIIRIPWHCIGRSREDLLLFRPARLRNALQFPIPVRFHLPDSLCELQEPTLFFTVFSCEYFNTGYQNCQEKRTRNISMIFPQKFLPISWRNIPHPRLNVDFYRAILTAQ